MMPRALTELGLIDALRDMLDISFSNSKIEYTFENHNMDERLPRNIEIGLYRISQELINNILKHSSAKKVDVQLVKRKEHIVLLIQDDGKGFSKKESDGIGIRNMNSRLNALNGKLNLQSDSNSGTTAIVRIAL
jgi:signal transduction histidine kinase